MREAVKRFSGTKRSTWGTQRCDEFDRDLETEIVLPLLSFIPVEIVYYTKPLCDCIFGDYLKETGKGSAAWYALGVGDP